MKPRLQTLAALATLMLLVAPVRAERLGLVIGINKYNGLAPLRNAVADADAIAGALRAANFRVPEAWVLKNPDRRKMIDAITSLAAATKPGDEVFLYYSGHGVQIKNLPLMMPADVRDPVHRDNGQRRSPTSESDIYEATEQVKEDGISLQAVANKIAAREPRLSMLVVDACRNNPVIDLLREAQQAGSKTLGGGSASTGFEAIEDGKNQIVIFAAGKGEEALDRLSEADGDPNSVFARVLLKKMRTPGLGLARLFNEVKEEVPRLASQRKSGSGDSHQQHPKAIAAFGLDEFYFVPAEHALAPVPPLVVPPVIVIEPPSGGGINLDEQEKQQAVRKQWRQWQAGMKAAFDKEAAFDDTAEAKLLAWDRYLGAYAQDNPFSAEDELLRAQAQVKRGEAAGEAEKQKAEALQQQQLAQQAAEEAARLQREQAEKRRIEEEAARQAEAKRQAEAATVRKAAEMKPGKVFKDCADCPEMVVIPAGSFTMGSPPTEKEREDNEGPSHRVSFARPYAMGKNAVTFDEWDRCVAAGGCSHKGDEGWGRGRRPVISVSWQEVQEYVKWLRQKTGIDFRLPSEAEWEYAARAGTTTPFYTGNCVSTRQANYDGTYDYNNCGAKTRTYLQKTVEVGSYPPNGFGLNDMNGNIWQWTEDCWHDNYTGAPTDGSAWTSGTCDERVFRGGTWGHQPGYARSAFRSGFTPEDRSSYDGFRLARTLP